MDIATGAVYTSDLPLRTISSSHFLFERRARRADGGVMLIGPTKKM